MKCPYCQQEASLYQNSDPSDYYKCQQHPLVEVIFTHIFRMFVIPYRDKIYGIKFYTTDLAWAGGHFRVEELRPITLEQIGENHQNYYTGEVVCRLNHVPNNLTPETALQKLQTILLFS